MDALNAAKTILSLGFIGTLLTLAYTHWRARIQPIIYEADVTVVGMATAKNLAITYTDPDGSDHRVTHFYIATVKIENRGNKDYEKFDFRVTLPPDLTSVETEITGPDNTHVAKIISNSSAEEIEFAATMGERHKLFEKSLERITNIPNQQLNFRIDLFNRWQVYTITMTVIPMVMQFNAFQRDTEAVLYGDKIQVNAAVQGGKVTRKKRWIPVTLKRG